MSRIPIRLKTTVIMSLAILTMGFIAAPFADEVVMTTGEKFTTTKIWEENGKIRFNMHGLVVSVNKSDVASITGTDIPSRPPVVHPNELKTDLPQSNQHASQVSPTKAPAPERQPPPPPSPVNKTKNKSKIKGIGFSGISWHMEPTDLPGLKKIKTENVYGGIDQYWRPDGSMTLGNVLLDGLVFGFWQNRLYSIMLWVDGKPAYDGLETVVLDRYGEGKKSKTVENRYVWVDDSTTDRMLEFDVERNIGLFWMRSRELDQHIKKLYPER